MVCYYHGCHFGHGVKEGDQPIGFGQVISWLARFVQNHSCEVLLGLVLEVEF